MQTLINNVNLLVDRVLPNITSETKYFLNWYNEKGKHYISELQTYNINNDNLLMANDILEGCKKCHTIDIICAGIIEAVSCAHTEIKLTNF